MADPSAGAACTEYSRSDKCLTVAETSGSSQLALDFCWPVCYYTGMRSKRPMPLAIIPKDPRAEALADRLIGAIGRLLNTTEDHRLAIKQAEAGNPEPPACWTCPHEYDRCGQLGGRCNPICL